MRAWPGKSFPLGASWDGAGVNFAIFSAHAQSVELCLFDSPLAGSESIRIPLGDHTNSIWHIYLPDARPGQLYGYRVSGPWKPEEGHRFNRNKVLLDPYAKAIGRSIEWCDEMFGYRIGDEAEDLAFDDRDNAAFAPLSVVIDPAFTWGDDRHPRIPMHKSIIYETHVKGLTKLHPRLPENQRGTYSAVASEEMTDYLTTLGVTAVELLPVQHFVHDRTLKDRGLTNYWGYNSIAYFAPAIYYSMASDPLETVREFKTMVKNLHLAGIEVILDVVYNHTAEGNHLGPSLCFRGVDNASYYRLSSENPRYYVDFTGCGNTFQMRTPQVLQLIMDSLRYWITEMHVDGFRFDLASALARELFEVDKLSAFFDIIHQDPLISQVKLIAEPWDIAEGGYQVGNFPVLWSEWNGKFRDCVRRLWKGEERQVAEFATRISGSSDLYAWSRRRPGSSINFITCHDGFTLRDLVSYNEKHNQANKENSADGTFDNMSWNCGVEGPANNPHIVEMRERKMRSMLATVLLAIGVPMIRSGDELGQTKGGNNNTYCQDNETTWLNWHLDNQAADLLEFTKRLITFRKQHPVLMRRRYLHGLPLRGPNSPPMRWCQVSGEEMTEELWGTDMRCFSVVFLGGPIDHDEKGEPIKGNSLLLLINAQNLKERIFTLPLGTRSDALWRLKIDTSSPSINSKIYRPKQPYTAAPSTIVVFEAITIDDLQTTRDTVKELNQVLQASEPAEDKA